MSLADEVLAEHKPQSWPGAADWCEWCTDKWPCEAVRLALSLKATEQVMEAARGHECPETNDSYCDLAAALAEYDKGGPGVKCNDCQPKDGGILLCPRCAAERVRLERQLFGPTAKPSTTETDNRSQVLTIS